jgi:hypothetical protein
MPDRTTILVLLLAGVVGAAALAVRRARGRRASQTGTTVVEPPTPPASYMAEARREFANVANKFSGLYEPLYRACMARPEPEEARMVLSEWEVRLTHGGGDALRHVWQSTVREATGSNEFGNGETADPEAVVSLGATWLDLLRSWGVKRDELATFEYDENEQVRYRVSGDPRTGDTLKIELPCWTYEGVVLEQGIARAPAEME